MSMDDFASALEASFDNLVTDFKPGQKVKGTVVSIGKNTVFVDVNSMSEAVINSEEFLVDGELTVKVGDVVEGYYLDSRDGGINLTVKMSGAVNSAQLEDAYANGIPVEGKVVEERKGGFAVKMAGEVAFCPYSQMSLHRVADTSAFIGNTYTFIITEYSGRNLVVSRRSILEKERDEKRKKLEETLNIGDVVTGTVAKIMDFGVFVDLDGVDGFIPISELSWSRADSPLDYVSPGDIVNVKVKDLDWVNNKITLSFRSAQTPWESIADKYSIGSTVMATITRLEPFGAFAQLEKGVEGLIHISKFGTGKRINHPREVVSVGDKVEVVVDSIDNESQRIALSRSIGGEMVSDEEKAVAKVLASNSSVEVGTAVKGIVDGITDFGVFVKLTPTKSGLLHVSQVDAKTNSNNAQQVLSELFPVGSEVEVVVQEINGDRISLTTLSKYNEEKETRAMNTSHIDSDDGGFGGLGAMFDGLEL